MRSWLRLVDTIRVSNRDAEGVMPVRTTVFLSNRSRAVRLPRAVAFAADVREVVVIPDGPRRIIAPADAAWDDFFDAPGVDLGERRQPEARARDDL